MRLLTWYVLREICQVFVITLLSLTLLMVLIGAVKEAIAQGLGAAQIVLLIPYLLPNALMFAVPGTILFSISTVYGRMSGGNEIVALKSLGISPMVVIWPALLLSVLISFATVWLNDLAMSWGFHGIQRVIVDGFEDIAYGMLRTHKSFSSTGFSVTVKEVEGRKLISPIFAMQNNGSRATVRADVAEFRSDPGSGQLTIAFWNASGDRQGQHFEMPYWEHEIVINQQGSDSSPAHLALRQIPDSARRQREKIQAIEQRMIAGAGVQMMTGDFDALAGKGWPDAADSLKRHKYDLYRMQTEPPRRWANGFSCSCFALVGAAMAIRLRNSDALTSFFLCFGPILLVYYPLLLFGVGRAKEGVISPYAVWLANVILVMWGLWLLRRVIRY